MTKLRHNIRNRKKQALPPLIKLNKSKIPKRRRFISPEPHSAQTPKSIGQKSLKPRPNLTMKSNKETWSENVTKYKSPR